MNDSTIDCLHNNSRNDIFNIVYGYIRCIPINEQNNKDYFYFCRDYCWNIVVPSIDIHNCLGISEKNSFIKFVRIKNYSYLCIGFKNKTK